jgi:hypothetical protein
MVLGRSRNAYSNTNYVHDKLLDYFKSQKTIIQVAVEVFHSGFSLKCKKNFQIRTNRIRKKEQHGWDELE